MSIKTLMISIFIIMWISVIEVKGIIVEGIGYSPMIINHPTKAYLMAKRAAILNAYKNAIGRCKSGFIKNAKVIKVQSLKNGAVKVIVDIPLEDVKCIK